MPEIVSTEILLLARTGPKTRRRRRLRHEHVSVPIFVILFRLLFSVVASKIRKYFVHRFIRLSNCPDNQSIHLSVFPFIHPFTHPSGQRFALVHQMLSRGSCFRLVHKYLARQLHLALSRGVYSALVCIISNLLNIFHIINFNYLCSLSLFFSILELISIRKGKRVENRDKTRQLAGEGRFHGASLSLITIGRAFVLDFSMSPLLFATMTRV